MPSKSRETGDPTPDLPEGQPAEVIIAEHGDIFLEIKDKNIGTDCRYRCSRNILVNVSGYFDVLFDPTKFSEGIAINQTLQELYKNHDGSIPPSKLPSISIADVGELPKADSSTKTVITLFLNILHDPNTPWLASRSQSLNLIALLAIVADRFNAHTPISIYLRNQGLDAALLKSKKSSTTHVLELESRQRLLAGVIFSFPQWVLQSSAALIVDGSTRWSTTNGDYRDWGCEDHDDALWWRLPGGLEDELLCRREYVLETLKSIQQHFIALYASRQPQCKLGYGSSPHCDSYQLGEIVRFFTRKELLRIESAFAASSDADSKVYMGNIEDLIAKFRECTSYQIDDFHRHCGLRTRLMPILDSLWPLNQVWICLDCWKKDKGRESWLENPHAGKWHWVKKTRSNGGCEAHRDAKAMYTASIRRWTCD